MSKTGLIEEELNRLKVIAEMIFKDEICEKSSYEDFTKALGFCFKDSDINPETAFKEMFGDKNGYFTLRKLIKAYLKLKKTPNEVSKNLQKFMEFMVGQTVKLREEQLGESTKGQKKIFNTVKCKNRKYVSKIKVFLDENKCPGGFELEYDGFYKMPLYNKNAESLVSSEEFEFDCLEEEGDMKKLADKVNNNNEFLVIDSVTQIYGTFKDKIQFIGFHLRSGKKYEYGNPVGEPFIYGHPERQFHGMKLEITNDKDITSFIPFFTKTKRFNYNIAVTLDDLSEDYLNSEGNFFDEENIDKITKLSIKHVEELLEGQDLRDSVKLKSKKSQKSVASDVPENTEKQEKTEKKPEKQEKTEKTVKEEKPIVKEEKPIVKEEKEEKPTVKEDNNQKDKKAMLRSGKRANKENNYDEVFDQEPEALDDDGEVNQYFLKTDKGFIFGIENKTKYDFDMELETGGLLIEEPEMYEGESVAEFTLKKRSRNTFRASIIPKYKGQLYFQFNSK